MGLGETLVRVGVAVAVVATAGCENPNVSATRAPEVAAASAGSRASTVPDATVFTGPRISTSPNVLRPPEIVQDPLKKQTADYVKALLDGRLDDLMNMTAIPYTTSDYRRQMQGYITSYSVCRDKKITDISIVKDQSRAIGVALFDSPCPIPFGPYLIARRDHIIVLFQEVDGKQQPVGIDIN